ncbi:MAG: hypothetical protein KJ852_12240 [Gammaproteobacteria bacterium]|nr:hypothetical protein [Gammaproteobacteria bacterium]MBU0786551.1 hypothetical protein [Gammaproteobacteria bacterium]MBU0817159.1 hypothetical protein [Gammaproteobacteria bacterium]MBU1787720.1 hypothetical protein [Gammaproteobacteria bacterium]
MYKQKKPFRYAVLVAALAAAFSTTAWSADDLSTLKQEVDLLKQQIQELRAAIKDQGQKAATIEDVKAVQADVAQVSRSQSRAMDVNSSAHLTGYGSMGYASRKGATGAFDTVQFAPIFHYSYKDLLFFETELNLKSNTTGGTDVDLEYANLNVFLNDSVTAFAGKFLTPIGNFFPNIHPAWINKFASRPPGFGGEGSAAPESAIGAGLRGGFHLGAATKANYALYVGNGPKLEISSGGTEITGVKGEASTNNPSNSKLIGGRFGVLPMPGLELGISAGTSKVGVVPSGGTIESLRSYSVSGVDFAYQRKALELRGEYIQQSVGNLASSVAPQGGTWKTSYVQAAYKLTSKWEPVIRYGKFHSPLADQSKRQWGVGLNYWVTPSAVAKIGYEWNQGQLGTANNDDRLLLQLAYGF